MSLREVIYHFLSGSFPVYWIIVHIIFFNLKYIIAYRVSYALELNLYAIQI